MGSHERRTGRKPDSAGKETHEQALAQETAQQRQQQDLQQHRRQPGEREEQVRREQGGHDRPVGNDHRPHRRAETEAGSDD